MMAQMNPGSPAFDNAFTTGPLEVAAAIVRLAREGACSLPLLNEEARRFLVEEAGRTPFRAARPVVGDGERAVRQDFAITMRFAPDSPFRDLARSLERHINRALESLDPPPIASPFRVNDLALQRYEPGSFGITPHRDHIRYVGIVALVILSGRAKFCVCADRGGDGVREIPSPPGCLLLMRAPGYMGTRDRPFHFVERVTSRRYSFGVRQDERR